MAKETELGRLCEFCGKEFAPMRKSAKFCTNACRTKAYRLRHNIPNPDFTRIARREPANEEEAYLKFLQDEFDKEELLEAKQESLCKEASSKLLSTEKIYSDSGNYWGQEIISRRRDELETAKSALLNIQLRKSKLKKKIEEYQKFIDQEILEKKQLVVPAEMILEMSFVSLKLNSYWDSLFGDLPSNFSMVIYGDAGAGKSNFALKFANELKHHGKTVYFPFDERISITIQKKIIENDIRGVDMSRARNKREMEFVLKKGSYKFVLIDSATKSHLTIYDIEDLVKKYPDIGFVSVFELNRHQDIFGHYNFTQFCDLLIKMEAGKPKVKSKFKVKSQ